MLLSSYLYMYMFGDPNDFCFLFHFLELFLFQISLSVYEGYKLIKNLQNKLVLLYSHPYGYSLEKL